MIEYDDFAKLDIKIGTIKHAEKVPEADRLLKLQVDVGEEKDRTIISGIAEFFSEPGVLIGKQVPVLMNLKPRVIRGHESQGMILYVVGEGEYFTTLESGKQVPSGTQVK